MRIRTPHFWTILVVTLSVLSFAFMNFYSCFQYWSDPYPSVGSIGWPAAIVGLSPRPGTILVPGFSAGALVFDSLLAISASIGAGIGCESCARSKAASAASTIRFLL